jgi:hypothetical protein
MVSFIGQLCTGMVLGYSAVLIPQLEDDAEIHGNHMTTTEKSLVGQLKLVLLL